MQWRDDRYFSSVARMDAACIRVFTVSTGYKRECSIKPASEPATAARQRRLLSSDSPSNSKRGQKDRDLLLDDGMRVIPETEPEAENGEKVASWETDTAVDADAVDPITGLFDDESAGSKIESTGGQIWLVLVQGYVM